MTERSANPNRQTPFPHPRIRGRKLRPENEVADQETIESEKYKTVSKRWPYNLRNMNASACNCSILNTFKYCAPPRTAGGELKEAADSPDGAPHEAEERCK